MATVTPPGHFEVREGFEPPNKCFADISLRPLTHLTICTPGEIQTLNPVGAMLLKSIVYIVPPQEHLKI